MVRAGGATKERSRNAGIRNATFRPNGNGNVVRGGGEGSAIDELAKEVPAERGFTSSSRGFILQVPPYLVSQKERPLFFMRHRLGPLPVRPTALKLLFFVGRL